MKTYLSTLGACALLTACTSTGVFDYQSRNIPLAKLSEKPLSSAVVSVENFAENYGYRNNRGSHLIALIPLAPFGYVINDNPPAGYWTSFSTIDRFQCNPGTEFAGAALVSLKRSNLFEKVVLASSPEAKNADFIFTGDIRQFQTESRLWSYGISAGALPMWVIGFPLFSSHGRLTIEFKLLNRSRETVWKQEFSQAECAVQGFYYNHGTDVSMFAPMFGEMMNASLKSIQTQGVTSAEGAKE